MQIIVIFFRSVAPSADRSQTLVKRFLRERSPMSVWTIDVIRSTAAGASILLSNTYLITIVCSAAHATTYSERNNGDFPTNPYRTLRCSHKVGFSLLENRWFNRSMEVCKGEFRPILRCTTPAQKLFASAYFS